MSKVRVYEVAKQLNMDQKQLVTHFQAIGLTDVKNHMSAVDSDAVDRLKRHLEKLKQPAVVEERIRPTVVRRKNTVKADPAEAASAVPAAAPSQSTPEPAFEQSEASPTVVARVPAPPPSTRSGGVEIPAERKSTKVAAPPAPRASEKAPEPTKTEAPAAPVVLTETAAKAAPAAAVEEQPKKEIEAPPAKAPEATTTASTEPAAAKLVEQAAQTPPSAPTPQAPPAPPPAASADSPSTAVSNVIAIQTKQEQALPPPAALPATPAASPKADTQPESAPAPAVQPIAAAAPPAPAAPTPRPAAPVHNRAHEAPRSAAPPSAPPTNRPAGTPSRPPGSQPKTGIEVWKGRPGVPMPPPPEPRSAPGPRRSVHDMRGPATGRPGQRPNMPPTVGGARPGGRPGMPMGGMRRGPGGWQQSHQRSGVAANNTIARNQDKKVIKIEQRVSLPVLAARMSLKATEVLMKLIQMGMAGVNINTSLDADTAKIVASEFGWDVEDVAVSEEVALDQARGVLKSDDEGAEPRPPIVTVMGHVDHGKTSLLDQIRKTTVASGEAGGITQHIGAYRVQTSKGPITFLDTPGHEAFTAMRARGASVTDIVVLVVAADDGVMPQTREAVSHARAAKVPIVVAVNKIDKPEADSSKVKRQLMELNLLSEEFGGDTIFCEVSAKTRQGVDNLLEMLALQAEVMELRANPQHPAHAVVVEALLDRGKGPVARAIVLDGTLKTGDFVLSGPAVGKIRAMTDDRGRTITTAGPATPVEILGLSDVPNAGEELDAVKDTKKAQEIAEQRRAKVRRQMSTQNSKITLDEIARQAQHAQQAELRVIVKADVRGSAEALSEALSKLSSPKVKLSIIDASVGAVNESDVNLAIASKALIIGFNVRPAGKAGQLAESEGIEIRPYSIIYNVIDDVRNAMEGLLAPILVEKGIGKAEVRQVFKLTKSGIVAGSMVIEGVIKRSAKVRVLRDGAVVHEGKIVGLKRFKDDVKDVAEGFECGISVDNFDELKAGDIFDVFEVEEVRQKL